MKRFKKRDLKVRDELMEEALKSADALQAACIDYNGAVNPALIRAQEALSELQRIEETYRLEFRDRLAEYNSALSDCNDWLADQRGELESFFDGKSEKWQEGDKGEAFQLWIEALQDDLEDLDMDEPELDCNDLDSFEGLPETLEDLPHEKLGDYPTSVDDV